MAERIGVYPGTFDPITLGHTDIIRRGAKLVDRLIIGVTTNPSKNPMFTPDVIVRGLRAVADFEYEYQMAGMNQQLNARIETVFLMAAVELQPIASKLVKEIALFGGDITRFVSPSVRTDVLARVEQVGRLGDY